MPQQHIKLPVYNKKKQTHQKRSKCMDAHEHHVFIFKSGCGTVHPNEKVCDCFEKVCVMIQDISDSDMRFYELFFL